MKKLKDSNFAKIAKWVWLVVVLAGVTYYAFKNYNKISDYFVTIHWIRFVLSFLMLLTAKLLLANVSRISVDNEGWKATYWSMLSLYSLTQLGKYLPGGVWHFVGRFGAYRSEEFDAKKSFKAMVAENVWLLSSAVMVGLTFLLLFNAETLSSAGIEFSPALRYSFAAVIVAGWIVALILIQYYFTSKRVIELKKIIILVINLVLAWLLIGSSYSMMFPEVNLNVMGLSIGGFSLSWSVGYVAVFAPGWIGVRELLLSFFFSSTQFASISPILATVHRLVWIITEVILGVFCITADHFSKEKEVHPVDIDSE